jgi:hypothetical protein
MLASSLVTSPDRLASFAEVQWGSCFDRLGVAWDFGEAVGPAGLGDLAPYFWFPESRQAAIIERGWDREFFRVVRAAARIVPPPPFVEAPDCVDPWLIILERHRGRFYGYARVGAPDSVQLVTGITTLELCRCSACRAWWWLDPSSSWACRRCGHHDGRRHLGDVFRSPLPAWPVIQVETPEE